MRKLLLLVLTLGVMLPSAVSEANACGDKLLRIGRNFRFHQTTAKKHPARLLIYTPANSVTLPGRSSAQIEDYFKRVGHTPLAVDNIDRLSAELKSGQYDLVLTDIADAAALQRELRNSPSQTVVLPVLYKRTRGEETAAAQQYGITVKNPRDASDFLEAIYRVMKSRATERKA